jgi:hypothetical protein
MTKHCVIKAYREYAGYILHIPNLRNRMEMNKTDYRVVFSHKFFYANVDPVSG